MKQSIIIFILLLTQTAFAQNNPIFFGGSGDGWSSASHMPVSNTTMNHGGSGDGWTAGSYQQPSNTTMNHGGSGDGWNFSSHMPVSNATLYHGNSGDGYVMQNFLPVSPSPSNFGNTGDGWAQNNHLPLIAQTLYKGGQGDGWASNVIPLGPLPVELLSFTGKEWNGTHILNWVTSMELNSSHFVVEHSVNASFFSELGMVNAAGNSQVENKYSFTNRKPVTGNNFYRLKMVDADQQYKYSNVVLLRLLKDNGSLMVYPNPAANILNIEMTGMETGSKLKVEIVDAGGKLLKSEDYIYSNAPYSLDVAAYANGLYFLKISGTAYSELVKFSIAK